MAISQVYPRKIMKNRTRQQSMAERHEYDQNPVKTTDGEWVSSYMCSPETAAEEFELSKRLYWQLTGRSQPAEHDVIMYFILQSFKPGEIEPEDANRLGYELAMKFTGGKHQFVVATHVEKAHIHTHIEFNSTNLDCTGKFKNPYNSAFILRRLNDEICKAHGYSVIEHPKEKARKQKEAAAIQHGRCFKEELRQTIDRVLPDSYSYKDFLARMRAEGYEIREGKELSFLAPGQERATRSDRLGDNYTRKALQGHFSVRRGPSAAGKTPSRHNGRKVNLLIDIQAKIDAGKGPGYPVEVDDLKTGKSTTKFIDGYIPTTKIVIEQKGQDINLKKGYKQSDGALMSPYQQARRYGCYLPNQERPRWTEICNFQEFQIHDMTRPNDEPEIVKLADLEKEAHRPQFLVDTGNEHIKKEMEISLQAGELVGVLYDALLKQYKDPNDPETLKSLNSLCVRLVFCLYAEDADIFGEHLKFQDFCLEEIGRK